jgi:protein tyrosine phosphatase (PTP) superfamily phosphohydrolase (DUF442 family)
VPNGIITGILLFRLTLRVIRFRKQQVPISPNRDSFQSFIIAMLPPPHHIVVNETEPIVTCRDPAAPHNFGCVSHRDSTFFTAERPGHFNKEFTTTVIEDWVQFMKSKGINNVLILMDENEFSVYSVDLKEFYQQAGMTVYHVPYSRPDSYDKTMNIIQTLDGLGEKVVSHCTGGKGRSSRVACAWLCKKWGLTPLEASQEIIDQAVENGLYRLADVQKLKAWIGYGPS